MLLMEEDKRNWNMPMVTSYHQKSRRIYEPIKRFEDQVEISMPQWDDSRNIFERMRVTCIADCVYT
jgi:hypothetical protein